MSLKNARKMTRSLTMRADSLLSLAEGKYNISNSTKNSKVSKKMKHKLLSISKDMFTLGFENIIETLEELE